MTTLSETPPPERLAGEYWRREGGRVELLAARCAACGAWHLPRPACCATCHGCAFTWAPLSATGSLYAYTIIHAAPPGYDQPYAVAYVDFAEGVRVFGHLALDRGPPPALDTPVGVEAATLVRRPDGSHAEGYRFVPHPAPGGRP